MSFQKNLIKLRVDKLITKKEMANLLDIPYTTYQNYENSKSEPSFSLLKKIASVLHVSIDNLLADEINIETNARCITELDSIDAIQFTPAYIYDNFLTDRYREIWNDYSDRMVSVHYEALADAHAAYESKVLKEFYHIVVNEDDVTIENLKNVVAELKEQTPPTENNNGVDLEEN